MDEPTREKVKEWLLLAEEDHISANSLLKNEPSVGFTICFHAQQFVEKALKAYLTSKQRHIEKTHDLLRIIKQCAVYDTEFMNYETIADELSPYATDTRYPDNYHHISTDEAKEAVANAERILNFVKAKLDPSLLI
ncbi:HEPN domain-containing protein [bacterium]|nr:HEPN domain-containing protein [bacterium]